MGTVTAPDGRRLTVEGLRAGIDYITFNAQVKLTPESAPHAYDFKYGLTLDAYRNLQLPPTYAITLVEEIQVGGRPVGLAHLRVEEELGGYRELIWVGVETAGGLIVTSFRGNDRDAALTATLGLSFEDSKNGIVLHNEIDESQRSLRAGHLDTGYLPVTFSRLHSEANRGSVPTNKGTVAAGGTLYRSEGSPHDSVVLITETVRATVIGQTAGVGSKEEGFKRALSLAKKLSVSWE